MTENNTASPAQASDAKTAPPAAAVRERRVGTLTFGFTLVVMGAAMMVSLFYPQMDFTLLMKVSPIILIFLGVEVLLSVRKGGRVKYDWLGMVLCFLFVIIALGLFFSTWMFLHYPDVVVHW